MFVVFQFKLAKKGICTTCGSRNILWSQSILAQVLQTKMGCKEMWAKMGNRKLAKHSKSAGVELAKVILTKCPRAEGLFFCAHMHLFFRPEPYFVLVLWLSVLHGAHEAKARVGVVHECCLAYKLQAVVRFNLRLYGDGGSSIMA